MKTSRGKPNQSSFFDTLFINWFVTMLRVINFLFFKKLLIE